jgi:hypothetical protein
MVIGTAAVAFVCGTAGIAGAQVECQLPISPCAFLAQNWAQDWNGGGEGHGQTNLHPVANSTCLEEYESRTELWINQVSGARNCLDGASYNSGLHSCVKRNLGTAQAGETRSFFGLRSVESKHIEIHRNPDWEWYFSNPRIVNPAGASPARGIDGTPR